MKITKQQLKQIIKEEIEEADPALLFAMGSLIDSIESLDLSIDYLSAAVTDDDTATIAHSQRIGGRIAAPKRAAQIKPSVDEAIDPAGLDALFQAIEKFATEPAVATAMATGGIAGALQVIKNKMKGPTPTPPETTAGLMEES